MLDAYGKGFPQLLGIEQQNQPGFTALDLQGMFNELLGVNGRPGYLSMYSQDVVPAITGAQTAANTALRTANVGDVTNMGPGAVSGIRALNPGQSTLMDSLTKTATGQLALGTQLDPDSTSRITSGVRTNWANRGLGTSGPAQLDEAMQLYGGGQTLLGQRESEAGSVANLNNSMYTNPALEILGGSSSAPQQAQTLTATGAGAASSQDLVSSSDLYDMFNTVFNANSAASIASANNTAASEGAQFSTMGKMGASLTSM
jgi:hypothetical protein